MLEVLGKNSRIARSSLAASEISEDNDTRCAKTIRNIITSHNGLGTNTSTNSKSLAASASYS